MSAFLTALFAGETVKATASVKMGDETHSITLRHVPVSMGEDDFLVAGKRGLDGSARVKTDDGRARGITGKGIYGAAAESATRHVLGLPQVVPADKGKKGKKGPEEAVRAEALAALAPEGAPQS